MITSGEQRSATERGKPGAAAPSRAVLPYEEAREYLGGISRSTLQALAVNREIRTVTIGRRRLFLKADLDQYLEDRAKAASAAL